MLYLWLVCLTVGTTEAQPGAHLCWNGAPLEWGSFLLEVEWDEIHQVGSLCSRVLIPAQLLSGLVTQEKTQLRASVISPVKWREVLTHWIAERAR